MSVSNTFHACLHNLCCFMELALSLHFSCRMELETTVTVVFILWFSVNFKALRGRRAMQRLTRRWHLRFLRYKMFRFRQAFQFIALVELSFSYFTRTCGVLRPYTIWELASSLYPSAILNVFGLMMIKITLRGCFNHAKNNHVSTMIRAMHCPMLTLFITKHISFVIRPIMFRPSVNTA